MNFQKFSLKLVTRAYKPHGTTIKIKDASIGEGNFSIIAGPCAVESPEQIDLIASHVKKLDLKFLRGGAFKPRTSPYAFHGLQEQGLVWLRESADKYGLITVSEAVDLESLSLVTEYSDIIQIGSRNMYNSTLLKAAGSLTKPILLKRGMSATIHEWLMAAESIMAHGNESVFLCERGIRTFETTTRNTFDISAIPVIKKLSHLPIIADPSHSFGSAYGVSSISMGAMAAGADGLLIEIHPDPGRALSDGKQSLTLEEFTMLVNRLHTLKEPLNLRF